MLTPRLLFLSTVSLLATLVVGFPGQSSADELRVPLDFPSIQAAIDASAAGDVVRVAPGTYFENLVVSGKRVVMQSDFVVTGDPAAISNTVIDGGGGPSVIEISTVAGSELVIRGFTLRRGLDGIFANGWLEFRDGVITESGDAIDFETGADGSLVADSWIHHNSDDAIDFDGFAGGIIERNQLVDNNDDGIEIRLHDFSGAPIDIIIQDNLIARNGEDGIQLIDGNLLTPRRFLIQRNLIADNAFAGIGMMSGMNTIEDFEGAPIAERIELFDNTFVRNDHGLTGGVNVVAVNNLFEGQPSIAAKNVGGNSILAHTLFFANGVDQQDSIVDAGSTASEDPLLAGGYVPQPGSPAIDQGTAQFMWDGELVLDRSANEYVGAAPDVGAVEAPEPTLSVLICAGTLGLGGAARRQRSRRSKARVFESSVLTERS